MNDAGRNTAPSEWATPPTAILVHDPVAAGAFAALDPASAPEEFLFRDHPDPALYGAQHAALVAELRRHVPRVHLLSTLAAGDPAWERTGRSINQIFTRDSLITLPWVPGGYIKSRMKPELRRAESDTMEVAVRKLGLTELLPVPETILLEGGDVVPFARDGRRSLLMGWGPRSTRSAALFLRDALVPDHADEVIAIQLADWRMNLDGGLLPVANDVVLCDIESIVSAELIDGAGERTIDVLALFRSLGMEVVAVTREESVFGQGCNCVCLGDRVVVCYDLCPRVAGLMRERGLDVRTVPGSELVKGRGGPRCMSRPIYLPPAAPGVSRQHDSLRP
jgi:N-dimethylarginine dimethylaminohydrolase